MQHPAELHEFCEFVTAKGVKSYLEIGAKFGGSLWPVVTSMPSGARVVVVELEKYPSLTRCTHDLRSAGYLVDHITGNSTDPNVLAKVSRYAPFDLILIDANHTEAYVRKDFANYGKLAKYCCFHDIGWTGPDLPGRLPIEVPKVWREIRETFKLQASFTEIKHDRGHNGIGIMEWH